jgi:PAT family beta-lactamase induction signal transducer AmpG
MKPPIATDATDPHPWRWIPSLYFVQGLPYMAAMTLSVVLYKNLGVDNATLALATSWLYLPWVVKPLWSPLLELFGAKRRWVLALQWVCGVVFALLALALPLPQAWQLTLALFWLMAFASATHDIAADGFYLLALPERQQSAFSGVRGTAWRLASIAAQGGLVTLAGLLQTRWGDVRLAWQVVFGLLAALFVAAAIYHAWSLPRPPLDAPAPRRGSHWQGFVEVWRAFFRKPGLGAILAFLLLFRFGEAQSLKMVAPFLLDTRAAGGLGLGTAELGIAYGTVGVAALTLGGLLGGWLVSRHGLKAWLWPMVAAVHLPNLVFVALAAWQPQGVAVVAAGLALEQFGYGFGFTAFMLAMIQFAQGPHRTAHYAICTGFMALGMMLPGMASGWLQQQLGYLHFFTWVCLATLPSFVVAARVRFEPGFGRRG